MYVCASSFLFIYGSCTIFPKKLLNLKLYVYILRNFVTFFNKRQEIIINTNI